MAVKAPQRLRASSGWGQEGGCGCGQAQLLSSCSQSACVARSQARWQCILDDHLLAHYCFSRNPLDVPP